MEQNSNKMILQIFVAILVAGFVVSGPAPSKETKEDLDEQARLDEFFKKYCSETDDKMFAKLEKCEQPQPEQVTTI